MSAVDILPTGGPAHKFVHRWGSLGLADNRTDGGHLTQLRLRPAGHREGPGRLPGHRRLAVGVH